MIANWADSTSKTGIESPTSLFIIKSQAGYPPLLLLTPSRLSKNCMIIIKIIETWKTNNLIIKIIMKFSINKISRSKMKSNSSSQLEQQVVAASFLMIWWLRSRMLPLPGTVSKKLTRFSLCSSPNLLNLATSTQITTAWTKPLCKLSVINNYRLLFNPTNPSIISRVSKLQGKVLLRMMKRARSQEAISPSWWQCPR